MTYEFRPGSDPTGDVFDRMLDVFKAARQAGVPMYTIDPRGLPDCSAYRGPCGDPPNDVRIKNQQIQMRTIAENTGGRAFVNMSDVPRAVRELVEDNNSFYLLGYYPEPLMHDGKFHDVDVKIKGRPDLKVRARAGYSAPKASKATEEDTKLSLNEVLSAALPVPGLQLRAAAAPVAIGEKGMKTAVTLEVTYPALAHEKFEDTLLLGMVAIDHEGKVKATARGSYKYSATPKQSMDVSYTINAMIDLPADPLTLRIAVASTALDRAASIHVPVEVINPNRDTLQFGSIVLGFAGAPRQTAVPPGALEGFVPIQPTMARVFSAKDTLEIYAPMFWRATDEASAIVTVAVRSEGQIVRQNRVDVTSLPAMTTILTRGRRGAFEDTLPLAQLVPGAYTLELVGHLTTGSTARRDVAFEVR
jgi:hypothetical protein